MSASILELLDSARALVARQSTPRRRVQYTKADLDALAPETCHECGCSIDYTSPMAHECDPPEERRTDTGRRAVCVIGMALPLGVNGQAPTRLHVFPIGEPPSNDDRKWRFTEADLKRAVDEFKARTEPLPILYDHGKDPSKGSKAAGWVDSVDLAADGLYANVRWTDTARQEIRSGEWGFRSPGWEGEEDADGFIYAGPLNEISLVNNPAIGGMLPVAASSQPSTQPTPPEKENNMANVEAAKKAAAGSWDRAGLLAVIKTGFPSMFGPDFPDDQIAELAGDLLEGGVEDEPAKDPMMPGGSAKPETPAVPAFAAKAAEDEAKTASATAHTDEIKALTERLKALEAQQLTGRVVTGSGADRTATATATGQKPTTQTATQDAPDPNDHVGVALSAYRAHTIPTHQAAIAYLAKARAAGKNVNYRDAVVAVSRKTA